MPEYGEPKYRYEKGVFRASCFKNEDAPVGGARPQWGKQPVDIPVDLPAGRYRVGVWLYEDTGNISMSFDRMHLLDESNPESKPESKPSSIDHLLSKDGNDGGFSDL